MISNADRILLQETYKGSQIGANTINAIIDKVEDEDLCHDLNQQAAKYIEIQQKAISELSSYGESTEGVSKIEDALIKTSVKANTLLDRTSGHIADLMIKGSIMGIRELNKTIDENKTAEDKSVRIANELINTEKHNIDIMKSYL